jgi:hypothetical protein
MHVLGGLGRLVLRLKSIQAVTGLSNCRQMPFPLLVSLQVKRLIMPCFSFQERDAHSLVSQSLPSPPQSPLPQHHTSSHTPSTALRPPHTSPALDESGPASSRLVLLLQDWSCFFKTGPASSRLVLLLHLGLNVVLEHKVLRVPGLLLRDANLFHA